MVVQTLYKVYLTDFSPKDKPWDQHRFEADRFRDLFKGTDYERYATRMDQCSGRLTFRFDIGPEGDYTLKLQAAKFCRVRQCPVCQWRRSLMWRARFFQVLPRILQDYPKARFVFLTLTVRNCRLQDLRDTLAAMNRSFVLLTKRKEWPGLGWVKAVEVTRGADDSAHPHFHVLLMVKPSYFTHGYLSQERWGELWQSCLKVNYSPVVDVRAIRPRKGTPEAELPAAMIAAVTETLKYSVKPSDVLREPIASVWSQSSNRDWLLELTQQLHKTRAIATGGVFKGYLAGLLEEDPEDLIHADEQPDQEPNPEGPHLVATWREMARRYLVESSD